MNDGPSSCSSREELISLKRFKMSIELNAQKFGARLDALYASWKVCVLLAGGWWPWAQRTKP
jgi:hypothetical protein